MNKIKSLKYQIIGFSVSLGMYFWSKYEWSKCPMIDCSESFIDNWLRTIGSGSLFLVGFFSLFLILPASFFKSWLKYIFSWGLPLSVYMTYITVGSSSIPAYGKVDVVNFWGIFFVILTTIFVGVKYVIDRKN